MLYIPAYWWYTFKFDENTSVSCFKYRTYMNNIAISPKICMYALQNQNVERKIAKQIDIKELKKKNDSTSIDELTNIEEINNEQYIPSILIPKDEPEPLPQSDLLEDTLINNDNIETIIDNKVISSAI
jgi:hypothetical protein